MPGGLLRCKNRFDFMKKSEKGLYKMKILVFSDSHGLSITMKAAIKEHVPGTDALIFLGDGIRDALNIFGDYPEIPSVIVSGNCDTFSPGILPAGEYPLTRTVDIDGVKFLCMHGHTFGVKSSMQSAVSRAAEVGADVLLYGHTHRPDERILDRVRVFNPGSIGCGQPCTYGVIQIVGKNIVFGHGRV